MELLKRYKRPMILGSDMILILFSYIVASLLRFEFALPVGYAEGILPKLLVVMAVYLLIFLLFGLYRTLWTVAGLFDYINVVMANVFSGTLVLVLNMVMDDRLSYAVIVIATGIILLGTLAIRMFFRIYRRMRTESHLQIHQEGFKNVLLIGAGSAAAMVIKEIRKHPELKLNIMGLVDDDSYKQKARVNGFPVLGTTDQMVEIAERLQIKEIIMAVPSADHETKRRILNIAKQTGAKLKTLPGMYEIVDRGLDLSELRDVEITDLLGRKEIKLDGEGIASYIEDKVVLVTGGGGSIGSELCRQVAKLHPKRLILLDIYENSAYDIQNELLKNHPELNLDVLIASVRDVLRINQIFEEERPQTVFHAAAHKHVPLMERSPEESIKNNVFGTYNVAEAAKKFKAEKFIMISTDKAVNPTNIMGATKRLCEMIVQTEDDETSDTEFVAVRFGNVLGSNGSVIPLFKKQIQEGGPVTLTHKDITRYFMTIPEAVQLVLQAGAYAKGGEIFVLDMGEPVKIYDLAENLIKLSGLTPGKDIEIEVTGLRPGEKLYEELLMAEEGLQDTPNALIFVGKPNGFEKDKLKHQLEKLNETVRKPKTNPEEIRAAMQSIVPTYVPVD